MTDTGSEPGSGFYYLNEASYDAEQEVAPDRSYLIASSPRSGSSLLARALWNRGTAGLPHEYFQRRHHQELEDRWEVADDLASYVGCLLARRSTPNGVFGFKAHFPQIQEGILDAGGDLFELFPDLKVVYIYRSDRISQAVSLELAARSGVWTNEPGAWEGQERPDEYRFGSLWRRLRRILQIESTWEDFFAALRIEPLVVRFEDLVTAVDPTVDRVLDHLGVDRHGMAPKPLPDLGSQHGSDNERLVRRFVADLARRGRPSQDR